MPEKTGATATVGRLGRCRALPFQDARGMQAACQEAAHQFDYCGAVLPETGRLTKAPRRPAMPRAATPTRTCCNTSAALEGWFTTGRNTGGTGTCGTGTAISSKVSALSPGSLPGASALAPPVASNSFSSSAASRWAEFGFIAARSSFLELYPNVVDELS